VRLPKDCRGLKDFSYLKKTLANSIETCTKAIKNE
jgi:hypothetical protein